MMMMMMIYTKFELYLKVLCMSCIWTWKLIGPKKQLISRCDWKMVHDMLQFDI